LMIRKLDWDTCNGCGICADICPTDVFRIDERTEKAVIRYPEECMTCFECENQCPVNAIEVDPYRVPAPLTIRYQ
jgi:NAD-dependent dihydropyrimidine dehydrogenase PreA subunit